jgi:uncharacterized membrane protein
VLTLLVCYARVAEFHLRLGWAAVALSLSACLIAAAAAALRQEGRWAAAQADARAHAGVHAAGAVAALALGCAMLLREHWLTLGLSLFLPALAWVEAQADLRPLRKVAIAVASVVLVRLLLNWHVLGYAFGGLLAEGGWLLAYGVPAAAFGLAAVMFARRGNDLAVDVLEAGGVALTTALVGLEIRSASVGAVATPVLHFSEAAVQVAALGALTLGTMHLASRLRRLVLELCWNLQGVAALAGAVLLILFNPALTNASVGHLPLLDWLLVAYLLPAGLAALALRMPATAEPAGLRHVLAIYPLVAGFAWITLEVRHLFHLDAAGLRDVPVEDAELWAWSGAWLAYGAALMAAGIWGGVKPLRLAALAITGVTAAKVFLVDMSGLVGLWRVVSFLGLGLTLVGLGAAYRRFVATREAVG